MASVTSSGPSYYDALGVSASASENEIAQAFRKAMGLFGAHSTAAAAQLGIAFETLRNPDKRRTYDEALGLKRAPAPAAPMALSFRISAEPPAAEPHVERSPASSIASSLREIARPVDVDPSRRPVVQAEAAPAPPPLGALLEEQQDEREDRPIDWKRPVTAVGAVVLAAGLVGALAGVSVKGDEQDQAAVTAALPPAKPRAEVAAPVAAEQATGAEPVVLERRAKARPRRPLPQTAASSDVVDAAADNAAEAPASDAAADPLAPQPDSTIAAVATAGLPVATKLVARTIERIGYACGQVASTSAVEGAAGVYKVTCTSGQSYRAAPVHGRYRFRRWGNP